jgi:hypothetical protein
MGGKEGCWWWESFLCATLHFGLHGGICVVHNFGSPNVLVVPSLHSLSPNHLHHTCSRPCRRPSESQKIRAREMGCVNNPKATRPHVHKMLGMCVSPKVFVVPSLHSLSPNHLHYTCARPFRRIKDLNYEGKGNGL